MTYFYSRKTNAHRRNTLGMRTLRHVIYAQNGGTNKNHRHGTESGSLDEAQIDGFKVIRKRVRFANRLAKK